MEGMPAVIGPVKTKWLVDENRSQRCLLCGEHCACRPQVLEIPMERENLGLQSSTIWAGFSSSSIHKNSETSNGTVEESQSEDSNLARRHVAHASTAPNVCDTNKNHSLAASETGISNKQTETCSGANEKSGIHRLWNKHSTDETVLANRESGENMGGMPRVIVIKVNKCQETGQNDWQNDSRSESNLTSTTAISTPSETENSRSTTKPSKLRNSSDTECGMRRRTEMVGGSHRCMEWQKQLESKPGSGSGNPDRCQQNRLGSTLGRDKNSGPIDSQRKDTTYQCARTEGSIVCSEDIHEKQIRLSHTCQGRQYNNSSLHQQHGGHEVTKPDVSNDLWAYCISKMINDLWAYCISKMIMITAEHVPDNLNQIADHQSRYYRDSSNRKLQTQIFKQIENCLGPVEIDLFADRINTQKAKFMSWKPDPEAHEDAFSVKWTNMKAYAFPPFAL